MDEEIMQMLYPEQYLEYAIKNVRIYFQKRLRK